MNETIVCAIRGGPLSQHTAERAIALAKERDGKVVFLYVVDVEFLGYATVGRPRLILNELRTTGSFMLNMVKERVMRQGIEADTVVRTGDVRRQIIDTIRFQDADVLVMGRPMEKGPRSATFPGQSFDDFVDQVKATTGVEVIVAEAIVAETAAPSVGDVPSA